ncbi:hypothetical protein TNCV_2937661 [Trichonephila clavipes]|nr:hypothetical protein TNCV_2937661 [Trichonephila clavipes]
MVRTTMRVLSYSTTAAQENQRPCSEKTKVYNGTAKNKRLFSTTKVKLRHFAFSSSTFPTYDDFQYSHSVRFRILHGWHSVIRTVSGPN